MSWHSVTEAAQKRGVGKRQIYKLIDQGKLQSQPTPDGTQVWLDETSELLTAEQPSQPVAHLDLPTVSAKKVTREVTAKVNAMLESIAATDRIVEVEASIAEKHNLPIGTQAQYKWKLRKLFNLPKGAALSSLATHPQIRAALESIISRKDNSNRGTLRSAAGLAVIVPSTGELISVEAYLKSLYPREGVNALACFRALRARALKKQIVLAETSAPITLDQLPSIASVTRFLRNWREENVSVRRGRSRKHDWQAQQEAYVTRDVSTLNPGEVWIGDHTELDFMLLNEQGKLDRRWITAFIDMRTGLIVGYNLNWQPCSKTIALAFRAGVLGSQLKALVHQQHNVDHPKYEHVGITNVPVEVMIDNGKDYRSKYTQRVFGKIDFEDSARQSVQRITRLHYTLPYHGQSKAQMERWFGIFQQMMKHLPGYKANKYENKPDSLAVDIKSGNVMAVREFDLLMALAINVYNNRVRRSLNDQTPIQCYLTNIDVQRTIDMRVLDFLMLKVERKPIHRCQLRLNGADYYSDALARFNGRRAEVYYDPSDLGFVSVYVDGEFAAVAANKEMIGQDEQGWKTILRDRKRGERTMQDELRSFKRGITDQQARLQLLEGELLNVEPVPAELLAKKTTTITLLTGLESDAKKVDEETKAAEELAEIEKKAKKHLKQPLTLSAIGRIR